MRKQVRSAYISTIAAATTVALAAGMTGPAAAQGEHTGRTGQAEAPSQAGASLAPHHRITLITGDRVAVDAKGRVTGFERAKGREHIPVQHKRRDGHTLVVPFDAQRLIARGKLDERLFDITELNRAENRKAQKKGVKVIVGYRGASASGARAEVADAGDTVVRRTLKSLDAQALTAPKGSAAQLWGALTAEREGSAERTTAAGVDRIWLDGVRRASLDKSVPQIGAPTAWKAGYTGKGIKIAVLDTGVDATHPDLKNQVTASKNFTDAKDATDHYGHGTHVASTAAGTGAKGGGAYQGVAPDASLLNGKVLNDEGSGEDSGILAGMEWAAAQGADVVNLSLGGGDTPEVDPLEAAVNKMSEDQGILFAIAAGNEGEFGASTVGSPGSADAALTVGAVDDDDKLAPFSSRGPRIGDGAIKPDVTAPGVDITAAAAPGSVIDDEVGQKPEGYLTISGTSMATPHVAGAAALLKQQHPDWTYAELKGALTGSTKPGAYTPFEQGSGRIAVDKALKQSVVADPVAVDFGVQQWPHSDDKPVEKKVAYRNLGTKDVTLDLTMKATGPKGKPAPDGFFTLGAKKVTVPAGGRAEVPVTADTRLGGTADGMYAAYVVATGEGQSVRTAAAVEREIESYTVTLEHIGRDGKPAPAYSTDLTGVTGLARDTFRTPFDPSGTVKVRVPKGGYLLNSGIVVDEADFTKGADWIAQPQLTVDRDTKLTLDARTTEPVNITMPDESAKSGPAGPDWTRLVGDSSYGYGWFLDSYDAFRSAHLGPKVTDGSLSQQWNGTWTKGDSTQYSIALGGVAEQLDTGYDKKFKAGELAELKVGMGAAASGKTGAVTAWGYLPDASSAAASGFPQKLPGTRTIHVSTADKVEWGLDFESYGGKDEDGRPIVEAGYSLGTPQTFAAGKRYAKTFNTAVFGPRVSASYGVYRDGNTIIGSLPLFADGKTHAGSSRYTSVATTLTRDGKKIGENEDPLEGEGGFEVPAGDAEYKLSTSVKRSVKVAAASTRIDASWTFRSKKTGSATALPVSTARFTPAMGLDSRVEAGSAASVPVTVHGAAAGKNLKSLSVYASYDYGKTWKKLTVKSGKVSVKNPAKGKAISFHAKIADKKGNKSTLSIYNAYYGK